MDGKDEGGKEKSKESRFWGVQWVNSLGNFKKISINLRPSRPGFSFKTTHPHAPNPPTDDPHAVADDDLKFAAHRLSISALRLSSDHSELPSMGVK